MFEQTPRVIERRFGASVVMYEKGFRAAQVSDTALQHVAGAELGLDAQAVDGDLAGLVAVLIQPTRQESSRLPSKPSPLASPWSCRYASRRGRPRNRPHARRSLVQSLTVFLHDFCFADSLIRLDPRP